MTVHKFAKTQRRGHSSKISKTAIALCAATLVGATANAAATYTTEDNGATLVVTSPAGETNALDSAQVVAGVTKIVKRGEGGIDAVPIASFTGDFDIEKGIWRCTAGGDLGATSTTASSGTIWMRDGASIEYAGTATKPGTLSGKTIHLYGAAATGATSGAKIFLSANIQMADPGFGRNVSVFLHDNASFYAKNRMSMNGTFDLGGYDLTFKGSAQDVCGTYTNGGHVVISSGTTLMSQAVAFKFAADCADTAYVEVKSGGTLNIKDKVTVANGWKIKNGGAITCNTQRSPKASDIGNWDGPIEFSGDAAYLANYGANIGGWGISNTVLNVAGPLSGSGELTIGPGWLNLRNAENTYSGTVTVRGKGLKRSVTQNGENVVPPGAGGIGVWNGSPVFANASSITLKDSARLEFMDETAASVGALTFVGDTSTFTNGDPGDDTQSIKGGSSAARSTIAGITKKGDNVLVVDSPVHVTGATIVSNGTLKIPFRSARGTPGLVESHATPKTVDTWTDIQYIYEPTPAYWRIFTPWNSNNASHCDVTEKGICAVGAQRAYNGMINSNTSGWDDGYVATLPSGYKSGRNAWWYSGYVWNNTDAPATYTVWFGGNGATGSAIWFGEDHSVSIQLKVGSDNTQHGKPVADAQEFTLQPGATKIDIVVVSEQNFWGQSVPSNGERYGLVYAPTSVCTAEHLNELIVDYYDSASTASTNALSAALRQFGEFKDEGGIGELFTVDVYGDADADKKVAYQPVFDDLEFAYGTTLDLSDNISFQVKDLTGSPTVVNAVEFRITNNWTICSADFPKADSTVRHPMTVDGKLVFAEGATFSVDDESAIKRVASGIVVATATDGIEGLPARASSLTKKWRLQVVGNNLKLCDGSGLVILVK